MRIADFHFLYPADNIDCLSLIKICGDGMVREPCQAAEQYPTRAHRGGREFAIHEFLLWIWSFRDLV
jgi:hypothetical protein